MRALTLWPEWAWAICHLGKDVENRPYPPPDDMRGRLMAIHAGKMFGGKSTRWNPNTVEAVGRVMDMAEVANHGSYIDWGEKTVEFRWRGKEWRLFDADKVPRGAVVAVARVSDLSWWSPWLAKDQEHWFLSSIKVLERPVPCRGQQRLWRLPPEVEIDVRRQYELLGGELH